jgi:hypothetical protein
MHSTESISGCSAPSLRRILPVPLPLVASLGYICLIRTTVSAALHYRGASHLRGIAPARRRPFLHASSAVFPASCSSPPSTHASKHVALPLLLTAYPVAPTFTCCSPPAPPSRLSLSTPASPTMCMLLHKHNRPLSHHPHHRCRRRRLLPASHAASASQHIYLVACATATSLTLPNELDLFWSPRTRYPLVTSRTTAAFCMLLGV